MKICVSIIMFLVCANFAFAQENTVVPDEAFEGIKFSAYPVEKIKVSEMSWEGHFGGTDKQPHNIFTLMSQGGFRAPTSKDHDKLIKDWLTAHPEAEAIVIYAMEGARTNSPDSKLKAVWITDGDENLNIYLVRKGDCPGGTMLLKNGDETSLAREEYKDFLIKLIEAGKSAKQEKIGIWNKSQ